MKVCLGLHKTVDDKWKSDGPRVDEPAGVMCLLDDGSAMIVVSDGRVMCFGGDGLEGVQIWPSA